MGTHRSRHNRGRKPLYKDYNAIAARLLARKIYGGAWPATRTWWHETETFKLDILCEANADLEGSADHFGRAPTTLCWKARNLGLTLPKEWADLIRPKLRKVIPERIPLLAYPYIHKARPEHADLLAINSIVPRTIIGDVRADVCQEIMLAILEGRTTLEALKAKRASAAYYLRQFYKDNFEDSGHAISFSILDDDRTYDEVASSIAAKEWREGEMNDRRRTYDTMARTFTPPTQFQAAFDDQISRHQMRLHELGQFLSTEEIEELLEEVAP